MKSFTQLVLMLQVSKQVQGAAGSSATRAECYLGRAIIHQKLKDYSSCAADMKKAVRLDDRNPMVSGRVRGAR